jgi:hypothetical protein
MTAALASGLVQDGLATALADEFYVAGTTNMNRVLMLVLVLGVMLPAMAQAQYHAQPPVAQQALTYTSSTTQSPVPVTVDFTPPGESSWVQQINDNPTPPPTSPGAAALNAQVNTSQMPAQPNCLGSCDNGCNSCCNNSCNTCCQNSCWPPAGVFCKHTFELEYVTGFWPSITNRTFGGGGAPVVVNQNDMIPQIVRLGMMWNDPHPDRDRWRGSFEGIIELDCLPIVEGAGNIVIGGSLLLRYNWAWRTKRFVPFFQFGGGGEYTDAYMFPASPTGNPFNFILQLGGGGHYFINDHWALSAEVVYFHMSNSGISSNNLGYNFVNGLFGFSYYFGRNMRD